MKHYSPWNERDQYEASLQEYLDRFPNRSLAEQSIYEQQFIIDTLKNPNSPFYEIAQKEADLIKVQNLKEATSPPRDGERARLFDKHGKEITTNVTIGGRWQRR